MSMHIHFTKALYQNTDTERIETIKAPTEVLAYLMSLPNKRIKTPPKNIKKRHKYKRINQAPNFEKTDRKNDKITQTKGIKYQYKYRYKPELPDKTKYNISEFETIHQFYDEQSDVDTLIDEPSNNESYSNEDTQSISTSTTTSIVSTSTTDTISSNSLSLPNISSISSSISLAQSQTTLSSYLCDESWPTNINSTIRSKSSINF
eukprot:134251_1